MKRREFITLIGDAAAAFGQFGEPLLKPRSARGAHAPLEAATAALRLGKSPSQPSMCSSAASY